MNESQVPDALYDDYLSNLIAGQSRQCGELVQKLLSEGIEVEDLYTNLFQRSLYRVGELWERGRISVATEHIATSITERVMALAYPLIFSREHTNHAAVVSCAANEYHQIGGRMVADMLEMRGWHGHFLGANTPVADLVRMIDEKEPDMVALSVSVYFNMPALESAIETVRSVHKTLPILVGGQALRWGDAGIGSEHSGVHLLHSLQDLEAYLSNRPED